MERKYLEELGLEKEIIDQVLDRHHTEIGKLKENGQAAGAENARLREALDAANAQIEAFQGMDIDTIKAAAEEWKTKYETAEAAGQKKLTELTFQHALERELNAAKAKNPQAVRALLEQDALTLNGSEIVGLKEQLAHLREHDAYLFEDETPAPELVRGGTGGTGAGVCITQGVFDANKNDATWINANWDSIASALSQGKLRKD